MFTTIKIKTLIVLAMVHLGLGFSLHALYRMAEMQSTQHPLFWHFAIGVGIMYLGVVSGFVFLIKPLAPWIRRANKISNWRMWIVSELPTILALIPVLIGALQILKSAWEDLKACRKDGKIDLAQLSALIRDLAGQADELAREAGSFDDHARAAKRKQKKTAA